jgi:inorganic pyrophosphatase
MIHPKMKNIIYEVDYGYLKNTKSMDNSGIDIWKGTNENVFVNGLYCTVDLYKRDSEIKILLNCTEEEIEKINKMYMGLESLKAILIKR